MFTSILSAVMPTNISDMIYMECGRIYFIDLIGPVPRRSMFSTQLCYLVDLSLIISAEVVGSIRPHTRTIGKPVSHNFDSGRLFTSQ